MSSAKPITYIFEKPANPQKGKAGFLENAHLKQEKQSQ
jgi:hypothetical protein